jgi:hypothetical protein
MHKLVNGEKVELSPEEEADVKAEWVKNEARTDLDPFDCEIECSPMLQAIIRELAEMSDRDESTVKAALKDKYKV